MAGAERPADRRYIAVHGDPGGRPPPLRDEARRRLVRVLTATKLDVEAAEAAGDTERLQRALAQHRAVEDALARFGPREGAVDAVDAVDA